MKRTFFCILALAAILALRFVMGRLLHKDDNLGIHPDAPITVIRVDGTKETGPYREMKDRVLQDEDRVAIGKGESQTK